MVFIMLAYLKHTHEQKFWCLKKPSFLTTGLLLLLFPFTALAEFSITSAEVRQQDNLYLMDANLNYTLTGAAIEALNNGVTLPLVLTISIERERRYWWDETIATLTQRYQLKFYALTEQYLVEDLKTEHQETFPTLSAALTALGKLRNFPLLETTWIKPEETYWVYLQIYLDIESLPVPLRPTAHLSSKWRLSSEWYLCPLQPIKP
jgi:Domain of unknown function (DUF4390)